MTLLRQNWLIKYYLTNLENNYKAFDEYRNPETLRLFGVPAIPEEEYGRKKLNKGIRPHQVRDAAVQKVGSAGIIAQGRPTRRDIENNSVLGVW